MSKGLALWIIVVLALSVCRAGREDPLPGTPGNGHADTPLPAYTVATLFAVYPAMVACCSHESALVRSEIVDYARQLIPVNAEYALCLLTLLANDPDPLVHQPALEHLYAHYAPAQLRAYGGAQLKRILHRRLASPPVDAQAHARCLLLLSAYGEDKEVRRYLERARRLRRDSTFVTLVTELALATTGDEDDRSRWRRRVRTMDAPTVLTLAPWHRWVTEATLLDPLRQRLAHLYPQEADAVWAHVLPPPPSQVPCPEETRECVQLFDTALEKIRTRQEMRIRGFNRPCTKFNADAHIVKYLSDSEGFIQDYALSFGLVRVNSHPEWTASMIVYFAGVPKQWSSAIYVSPLWLSSEQIANLGPRFQRLVMQGIQEGWYTNGSALSHAVLVLSRGFPTDETRAFFRAYRPPQRTFTLSYWHPPVHGEVFRDVALMTLGDREAEQRLLAQLQAGDVPLAIYLATHIADVDHRRLHAHLLPYVRHTQPLHEVRVGDIVLAALVKHYQISLATGNDKAKYGYQIHKSYTDAEVAEGYEKLHQLLIGTAPAGKATPD